MQRCLVLDICMPHYFSEFNPYEVAYIYGHLCHSMLNFTYLVAKVVVY